MRSCCTFSPASLDCGEPSSLIRQRVERARELQQARFAKVAKPNVAVNGDMRPAKVQTFCPLDEQGRSLMRSAATQMALSARAYHRVLKLARTIGDLAGEERIQTMRLAEALQYRPRAVV